MAEKNHNAIANKDIQCKNSCCAVNPNVCQNLEEMDFEKGIWTAALDNNVERITHLIIYRNVPPDMHDSYGYTALHYAARNGKLEAAKCLLKNGAIINSRTKNNGATSLHRATSANQKEMVKFLLQQGADETIEDFDGLTAIDRAIKEGHEEIVKLLEKRKWNS